MKRRARIGLMFDYLIPAMLLSLLLAIPAPVNIVSTGTAPFFTALVNSGVGVANGYAVITQGLISYVSEDVNSVLVGSPSFAPVSGGPSVSTTPSLSISPTTSAGAYYYEATYSSEIQSVTFNVTNAGGSSTGLLAIKLSDSSVFTKSSDFCTGRALAPKSSCSVIISYAPISGRAETDSVFLAANGKRASTSIILIGTSPGLMLDQATCSSASAPTDFSGIWNSTASTCTVTTGALSSGYTLVVPSGTKMIVGNRANGSAFSNYGTVNVESGGSVDNYGAFTDEMSGIVNNRGAFTNEFSGTITFENGVSGNIGIINGYLGKFYNYGSIIVENSLGCTGILNEGTFENHGMLKIQSGCTLSDNGKFTNESTGVINNYGGLAIEVGGSFDNFGALTGESTGGIENDGMFTNESSGTLTVGNSDSNLGMDNAGELTNFGSIIVENSGHGGIVNSSGANFVPTFTNSGFITIENSVVGSIGIENSAAFINSDLGIITIENSGACTSVPDIKALNNLCTGILNFSVLNNLGIITVEGSGSTSIGIDNSSFGTFNNYGILSIQPSGIVDNHGALTNESAGVINNDGAFRNEGTFTNYGTVNG